MLAGLINRKQLADDLINAYRVKNKNKTLYHRSASRFPLSIFYQLQDYGICQKENLEKNARVGEIRRYSDLTLQHKNA